MTCIDIYYSGKDNFEADRVTGEKILALVPQLRQSVVENRRFIGRVVRFLAAEAGIDQFLDIGAGLPTRDPVHQVAQKINPRARVVYVDYDPVVVTHGSALLTVPDRSLMVRADLRRPDELLAHPELRGFLDLSRPVAVMLIAIMHFVLDSDDPYRIVAALRDGLAPGSYLAMVHLSGDFVEQNATAEAVSIYEHASARLRPRSKAEILRFFDGFELVPPGLVPKHEWRPDGGPGYRTSNVSWGGVGRKNLGSVVGVNMPGVRFVRSAVRSLDPAARRVVTDGEILEADILVVALGADLDSAATPGLAEGGHEFYTVAGAFALRGVLERFAGGQVVVGVTSTPFKCPPAPSETALLMHDFLQARGLSGASQVSLVMPLGVPIPPSPKASQVILAAFAERGIGWHPGRLVRALDPGRKVALLSDGAEMPYDLFLGVPVHRAPAVVAESGLTADGWIEVDPRTLQTRYPGVYAVGDVTSVGTPKAGSSPKDRPQSSQRRSAPRSEAPPRRLPTTAAASATWNSGTTWSPRSMSPSPAARAPSGILKDHLLT